MVKTPDFKKLQREWYDKLQDEGFTDIESTEWKLKRYDSHYFSQLETGKIQTTQEYYSRCEKFLKRRRWKYKSDRVIWKYHSQGWTEQRIGDKLGVHKSTVSKILKRLREEMVETWKD